MEKDNKDKNPIEENLDISSEDQTLEVDSKKLNIKKLCLVGGCILAVGAGAIFLSGKSPNSTVEDEEFQEFSVAETPVKLNFKNKTAEDMREYYTLEGEEFIKRMYPDSDDSNFALLTVGKSIDKDLSKVKFTTADNTEIYLKDLKGKRVILDFAMTSCPNCRNEYEFLSTKKMGENEVFLHIFPQDTTEDIKKSFGEANLEFRADHTVSFSGMNNLGFEDFKVTHVPSKIYINEEGIVTYVTTNTLTDDEIYKLHYDRAFGEQEKMLDFLKLK